MLIRREPILLYLTSKESATDSFTLPSKCKVHVIPPQDGDVPSKIEIISHSDGEIDRTLTWDERGKKFLSSNKRQGYECQISAGEYRIVADRPGAIVYMTPVDDRNQPDYSDAIYLMADTIVNLEDRMNKFETFMNESKARFLQIEDDIP